jgi:hypothetical protein
MITTIIAILFIMPLLLRQKRVHVQEPVAEFELE